MFSFPAIKHVTSVDGGCLVCKDPPITCGAGCCAGTSVGRRPSRPICAEIDIAEAGYKFHMNNVAAAIRRGI